MEEEQIQRLRDKLNQIHVWPSIFMFKFILPSDAIRIQKLKLIFGEKAEIKERLSANGKYTSLTIREMMMDADAIFVRYMMASEIEGVISL